MTVALITGSAGLVGAEAVRLFARRGMTVVGIDNDMRRVFFGEEGSTRWQREMLEVSSRWVEKHFGQAIVRQDHRLRRPSQPQSVFD